MFLIDVYYSYIGFALCLASFPIIGKPLAAIWIIAPIIAFSWFILRPIAGWILVNLICGTNYKIVPGTESITVLHGTTIHSVQLESGGAIFEIPESWMRTLPPE